MSITKLQKKILDAKENKIAVCASAAALKTSTLTEKTRQLLLSGVNPSRIAVITFTRMAAQELINRLGDDYQDGIFIGTIHSLAAHFLSIYNLGDKIGKIAEEENFDKLFTLCQNLQLEGFFDWVLLDEAQDSGEEELNFIFSMINPPNFFVCYDLKQSIYGFKGARPDLLQKYLTNSGASFYSLNENFRNGANILAYAKRIIRKTGLQDDSIAMKEDDGIVQEIFYDSKKVMPYILRNGDFKDWAILTRTNAQISMLRNDLEYYDIPYNTFKQGDLNRAELDKKMQENKVKLITIHSSKGLGFKNVLVYGAVWWNNDEYFLNYVAATRAKDLLIWAKAPAYRKKY